ncbi:hypothetical protein OF83DRAFT_32261 [Amylostereum chailletii]|nr:hypothetical protein OF83DRAFT_32261 [Amylostereum chailletii]
MGIMINLGLLKIRRFPAPSSSSNSKFSTSGAASTCVHVHLQHPYKHKKEDSGPRRAAPVRDEWDRGHDAMGSNAVKTIEPRRTTYPPHPASYDPSVSRQLLGLGIPTPQKRHAPKFEFAHAYRRVEWQHTVSRSTHGTYCASSTRDRGPHTHRFAHTPTGVCPIVFSGSKTRIGSHRSALNPHTSTILLSTAGNHKRPEANVERRRSRLCR